MAEQITTAAKAAPTTTPEAAKDRIVGTYTDNLAAQTKLDAASKRAHVVSPALVMPKPPEGFEIAIAVMHADRDDTYDVGGGKLGLGKSNLQRIALNAGVTWVESRRLDDGSHPHYCAWQAIGKLRGLDGTESMLIGNVEIDLRDGSAQIEQIRLRAKKRNRDASGQIAEMRGFISRHAETKSMLRAIRSLGIRTAYAADELSKPFCAVRLMFTGQSTDPELRRRFATMRAEKALASETALYGAPRALPAPAAPTAFAPPAVSARTHVDVNLGEELGDDVGDEVSGDRVLHPDTSQNMPGKKDAPKVAIKDAADKDLDYWEKRLAKNDDRDDRDELILASIRAEQTRRASPAPTTMRGGVASTADLTEGEEREIERAEVEERERSGGRY